MKNHSLGKTDKSVYDYPDFQPKICDDEPKVSNVTENVASTQTTGSVAKSIMDNNPAVMSMKNPLYVPSSKTITDS